MCPACGKSLIILEFRGVELDYCVACRGVWLDAGELELISELAGAPPGPLHSALGAASAGTTGRRRCPRCRRKLQVVTVRPPATAGAGATRSEAAPPAAAATMPAAAVELDKCPAGHGLWLDAGELQTIVRDFAPLDGAAVAAFFADLFGNPNRESPARDAESGSSNPAP